jgi:hypothetical protein
MSSSELSIAVFCGTGTVAAVVIVFAVISVVCVLVGLATGLNFVK